MNRWLRAEYRIDPTSLGVHRILFVYVAMIVFDPQEWIVDVNDHLFRPAPGPLRLLNGFPTREQLKWMHWLTYGALGLLGLGVRSTLSAAVFSVIAIALNGYAYSVEKVHHHIVFFASPLFLALSPWGNRLSLDPFRKPGGESYAPLNFLALFIGSTFFSSAVVKTAGGWLDWHTQAARAHVASRYYSGWNRGKLAEDVLNAGTNFLWELADWGTIAFEGIVLFSIIRLRFFRLALAAATVFHYVMFKVLGVNFVGFVAVYAAFIDWKAVEAWWAPCSRIGKGLILLVVTPALAECVHIFVEQGFKQGFLALGAGFGALFLVVRASMFVSRALGKIPKLGRSLPG